MIGYFEVARQRESCMLPILACLADLGRPVPGVFQGLKKRSSHPALGDDHLEDLDGLLFSQTK
jgi:hypothetical protein